MEFSPLKMLFLLRKNCIVLNGLIVLVDFPPLGLSFNIPGHLNMRNLLDKILLKGAMLRHGLYQIPQFASRHIGLHSHKLLEIVLRIFELEFIVDHVTAVAAHFYECERLFQGLPFHKFIKY